MYEDNIRSGLIDKLYPVINIDYDNTRFNSEIYFLLICSNSENLFKKEINGRGKTINDILDHIVYFLKKINADVFGLYIDRIVCNDSGIETITEFVHNDLNYVKYVYQVMLKNLYEWLKMNQLYSRIFEEYWEDDHVITLVNDGREYKFERLYPLKENLDISESFELTYHTIKESGG